MKTISIRNKNVWLMALSYITTMGLSLVLSYYALFPKYYPNKTVIHFGLTWLCIMGINWWWHRSSQTRDMLLVVLLFFALTNASVLVAEYYMPKPFSNVGFYHVKTGNYLYSGLKKKQIESMLGQPVKKKDQPFPFQRYPVYVYGDNDDRITIVYRNNQAISYKIDQLSNWIVSDQAFNALQKPYNNCLAYGTDGLQDEGLYLDNGPEQIVIFWSEDGIEVLHLCPKPLEKLGFYVY